MEILVSKVDAIELAHPEGYPFEAKLLQVLGFAESSGFWRWGALLLAVAATLASIIATRRHAGFLLQSDAAGVEPCRSPGDDSTLSSAVSFSSHCQPEDKEEPKADTPHVALHHRVRTPDSDGKTKGKMWLKEEEQLEDFGAEAWDLSNGEVVKSWSQSRFAGGSSRHPIIRSRLPDERSMPVVAVNGTGDTAVWDPRASFQAPMISSRRHRQPASEMDFDGVREILVSYGGRRNNVLVPDLRMLSSNFDAGVMPWPNFGSLIWEDDAVIVPHEDGNEFKEDELLHACCVDPFDYSQKGIDSKSMVFWFLNSVRSISSSLKD